MIVIIIAVVVVFIFIGFRKQNDNKGIGHGYSSSGKRYAEVFIYNGDFRKATYLCDQSYYEKEIVVVNYMGSEYAGRILQIHYERPSDVPRDVVFKSILRPFRTEDINKVAYWNDGIEKVIKGS